MSDYGKIKSITEVEDAECGNVPQGDNLGFMQMASVLMLGGFEMNGYVIETDKTIIRVLIDNGQSCCEDWGYFSSEDNLDGYIGAELRDVVLTDTSLKTEPIEELEYLDAGGVQFVTFVTDQGDFQLAVYNAHNGYYGHSIIVAIGDEVKLNEVL